MLWANDHLFNISEKSLSYPLLLQDKIYRGYTKVPYYRSSADTSYAMMAGKRQAQ